MDKLEYKGYFGSVEYSKTDDCLFGKVLGLNKDCITYEGNTVAELKTDFMEAIDTYLEHCQRTGVKPSKAYNGVLNIRIPPTIHSRVAAMANNRGTSINAFIRETLERRVEFA